MINLLLPERSAINQSLGHPAAGVIGWQDLRDNTSGVEVTEKVALTYSAVWAATRVISETVATLPCILYRRTGEGKERATDDSRYSLVHDSPNEMMTPYTYFETTTAHMVLWGNLYSKIVSAAGAQTLEVRLPDRVRIAQEGDSIVYKIDEMSETVRPMDMLHVAGLGFDGIQGYGVVRMASQSIGTALASERYAGSFFGNGAQPNAALIHPQRLSKEHREAFRKEWNEVHRGSDNAHKVAILHGGIEYKQLGLSNEDAQFLESRQFSVGEIARWFRLPPHLLADLTRATFSNIEQQALEFVKYSITPWLRRWETALNKKLLRPSERREMFFEFLVDALLRGDLESRYQAFATARQWGWLNVNEIRAKENMNPIGAEGDMYLQPMNMDPAGTIPDTITGAWSEQFGKSVAVIAQEAAGIRDSLTGGLSDFREASTLAEQRLADRLSGIHDQQAEMRKEISSLGSRTQIASVRKKLEGIATHMVRSVRLESMKHEGKTAIWAAKRELNEGHFFVAWLDDYYEQVAARLTERLEAPIAALIDLGHEVTAEILAGQHAEQNRQALLACADGDRDGFLTRVEALVLPWGEIDDVLDN